MLEKQIELEKKMTDDSVNSYRNELNKALQKENFSNTQVATTILSRILDNYTKAIEEYIDCINSKVSTKDFPKFFFMFIIMRHFNMII